MILEPKKNLGDTDIVLIGAGVMSATLGIFLKELNPNFRIKVYERLDTIAAESSDAWNNAGTGHSALCELNYTVEKSDGSIDIKKAIKIMESFEVSKQFWAYLVAKKIIKNPANFITSVPHISFVTGSEDISFLRRRYQALRRSHLFKNMEISENFHKISSWIPLMMKNRNPDEPIAATFANSGTDINFGNLTREMFDYLEKKGVEIFLNHEVKELDRNDDQTWEVEVKDLEAKESFTLSSKFVFIGAGGGSLDLLNESDIPEGDGYGGFPVSGQWLVCKNEEIIKQHHAKVYGKAKVGSPPMSVPHLDSRLINGKRELLFGPFAGFSTKFLKEGSYLDLPTSFTFDNIIPMLGAGIHNLQLTKYLIQQVLMSHEEKVEQLREFVPNAQEDDWELAVAGQRVQVIKKDEEEGGVLEFGTEVIAAADGSIAALLGASPGASTSVSIMLKVMNDCFPEQMQSDKWVAKLKAMIPSYGVQLADNEELTKQIRRDTNKILKL